jgi:hypothetical protein
MSEIQTWQSLRSQMKSLDSEYFRFSWEALTAQMNQIQRNISEMQRLRDLQASAMWWVDGARASGWPVSGGSTYIVGEKWPELFTPSRSWYIVPNEELWWKSPVININMWGVSVRSESDMNTLVNKIKTVLTQELKMNRNFWIA